MVQATPQEKRAIMAKARKLRLPISELMRRGAVSYQTAEADAELSSLADAAKAAADRASAAIDEALAFIEAYRHRRIRPGDKEGVHTPESVHAYLWGICNRLFFQAVRRSQARPHVARDFSATAADAQDSGGLDGLLPGGPRDDESRLWEVLEAVAGRCRPEDIIVTWLRGCGFSI